MGVAYDCRPPAIFVGDALGWIPEFDRDAGSMPPSIGSTTAGYLSWLDQAHLVPGDVLRDMRARALPGELDKVADQPKLYGNGSGASRISIRGDL